MNRFEFRCVNPHCGFQSSIQYSRADSTAAWCPDCRQPMTEAREVDQ